MLPVNVDYLGDLFSYICTQKRFFFLHGLYNKSLKDWSLRVQTVEFVSLASQRFSQLHLGKQN